MSEVKGIKETMDLVPLVIVVAQLVAKELETDGLQLSDFLKIAVTTEFRQKLGEAVAGIGQVPAEWRDMSKVEAIDLIIFALTAVRPLLLTEARAA